jgi:acetyl esterase/lipase
MMYRWLRHVCLPAAVLGAFASDAAGAQGASRPVPMRLWAGAAPGALGQDSVDVPTVSLYRPSGTTATSAAIVICPGGSYGMLADHEGHTIAVWLNSIGVTAAVLKYRLGPRYHHPVELQDVARAMRTLRARAAEWGIDPHRIGIMGFSAGGHLASTIATHFDAGDSSSADPIERASSRPDIAVLAYPVISMTDGITHEGSRRNLLGDNPTPALEAALSNEEHVTAQTPPTFLFHTANDPVVRVENSLLFAAALRAEKVPFELHVFEQGPHGVGLAQDDPVLSVWPSLLQHWLRVQGFVP